MPLRAEETLSLQAWLLRGAIREDDYTGEEAPNPQDDRHNTRLTPFIDERPLNHFYDPIRHRALTVAAWGVNSTPGERAPDWGLGSKDVLNAPDTPNIGRRNHFTVRDAREAQYRALTGRGRDSLGREVDNSAPTQTERNKYWATTFRALGDVVHLVQDMAQPQHTRNDPHAGKRYDEPGEPLGLGGHKSTYEAYIEARATGGSFTTAELAKLPKPLSLKTIGLQDVLAAPYPTPRFDDYLSYFTTRHRAVGDLQARRGMADYTNRGFFSAGTNLGHNDFPSPVNNPAAYAVTDLYVNWAGEPLGNGEKVSLLMGTVPDSLPEGASATNVPLTTFGAWDEFLTLANRPSEYTLNRYNYDAMAALLLPRAVAYSAGFIDHFFRGRLEVQDAGFTETGVILRVKNAIDRKKTPAWAWEYLANGGKLIATLRYELPNPADPKQPEVKLFSSPPVTLEETVNPGKASRKAYTFEDLPEVPEEATKVEYRLVYRGRLGNEDDAIAVGTFKPVSGILVTVDGASDAKLIRHRHGGWRLARDTGLQAGNIDWKGWYQDGKPTKVLSWQGSQTRYFPDDEQYYSSVRRRYSWSFFGKEVYQDGAAFATAPQPVLGASVVRDTLGDDWLVVVCMYSRPSGGVDEVVYRRPYKKSTSAALYEVTQVPDGWQEIGRFDWQQTSGTGEFAQAPDTPWFFNGEGTEAQTMRRYWDDSIYFPDGLLKRLKLVISLDVTSASIASLGNDAGFTDTSTCSDGYSTDQLGNVSGGGTRTVSSGGSYVIAVDYGADGVPILARIEVAGGSRIENWSVSGPHGSHTLLSSYKEKLTWSSGASVEIMHDNTSGTLYRSWGPDAYTSGIGGDWAQKEVSYLFDLRDQSYAFLNTEAVSSGTVYATLNAEGRIDGYRISRNSARKEASGRVRGAFVGPDRYVSQSSRSDDTPLNGSPDYYFRCGNILFTDNTTDHHYGTSNMGWWRPDGSAAVDSQGQYAASWQAYSSSGYDVAGPVSEFSDQTSLEKLFPGVQRYYPIRLVR